MSLTVRQAVDADRATWDAFVAADPGADVLQAWAWGEAWRPAGETPLRLLLEDAGGEIEGLAQALVRPTSGGRSIVYVPHGPLWRRGQDAPARLACLLEAIAEAARTVRAIVVKVDPRGDAPPDEPPIDELLRSHGLVAARHDLQAPTTRIVDLLDGGAALAATWHKDERNRVRRADREGVTSAVSRTAEPASLGAFAALLRGTSERAGFRARPADFLGRLAAELEPRDAWFLAIAERDGRPIAGVVTPRVGDRAFYLYGASARDPDLQHAFGSDAAMAAAMAALAADGVRTLDLWGVAEPGDDDSDPAWAGFSLFKRRFGGRPIRHPGTYDLVIDRPLYLVRDARERIGDALGRGR